MPTVISFANMKGGVGKTTLCVNLAFELFTQSNRVLVVDNDPQFNATNALLDPTYYIDKYMKSSEKLTIYNIYEKSPGIGRKRKSQHKPAQFIKTRWYKTHDKSITLDLIASSINLYETLWNPSQKEYVLDKFLTKHCKKYDYIFIDCPPTPSVLTSSAFAASDYVIIPIRPDYFSTIGLPQFLATLEYFKERLHDDHDVRPLGVIFTDVDKSLPDSTKKSMKRVEEALQDVSPNIHVFKSRLSHLEVFKKTLWQAMPVQRITGRGTRGKVQAEQELRAIANELIDLINQDDKTNEEYSNE
jgi:chromosome partitioning protein